MFHALAEAMVPSIYLLQETMALLHINGIQVLYQKIYSM